MSKILISTILAILITACGSNSESTPDTTSTQETGGSSGTLNTTSVAGVAGLDTSKVTGGSSSVVDTSTTVAGSSSTGGSSTIVSIIGGSSSTGGNSAKETGGSQSTGGSSTKVTGGSSATGGSSTKSTTGGNQPTGGSTPSTGGSAPKATGGSNPGTGGSAPQATGGSAPQATGGTPSTGGSSTAATGGSNPSTGGTPSTGGSAPQATGGSTPSTGGSSAVTPPVPTQVSVGSSQTCVVLSDGHIKCWGSNTYGQLGDGTTTNRMSPVFVNGISTAVSVSTYRNHTCSLLNDGTVKCWGLDLYGELGDGKATANNDYPLNMSPNPNPVQFLGVSNAIAVAVGAYHTCVILADHTLQCVGFRGDQGGDSGSGGGLLGDGVPRSLTNYYSVTPVQTIGINNAIAIAANSSYTCALLSDKTIKCWGYAQDNEFTGNSLGVAVSPVSIPGITDAIQLSVGSANICYRSQRNGPFCWGATESGQFGGTPSSSSPPLTTPTSMIGYSVTYQQVALQNSKVVIGETHGCVLYNRPSLTTTSVIWCFGNNAFGQLGDGTTTNSYSNSGTLVSGITNAQDVSAGGSSTCAILATGSLQCWGTNPGNSMSSSSTPVTVAGF